MLLPTFRGRLDFSTILDLIIIIINRVEVRWARRSANNFCIADETQRTRGRMIYSIYFCLLLLGYKADKLSNALLVRHARFFGNLEKHRRSYSFACSCCLK